MARKVWVRNQRTALWLGVGGVVVGAGLIWDAHEHRGKARPFWLKFLPGA